MHKLIRIIGAAEDRETAAEQAYAFADELVERGEFDHYVVDSERYEASGYSYSLAEAAGQLLVREALQATREAFDRALYAAKVMIGRYTADQIYNEDFPDEERDYYASRHEFGIVGGYTHDSWIYGDDSVWSEKIQNDKQYAMAIQDIPEHELWVTCLDMHH